MFAREKYQQKKNNKYLTIIIISNSTILKEKLKQKSFALLFYHGDQLARLKSLREYFYYI